MAGLPMTAAQRLSAQGPQDLAMTPLTSPEAQNYHPFQPVVPPTHLPLNGGPTPLPSPLPSPTPAPSPMPTPTPAPSPTPAPTPAPAPAPAPTPQSAQDAFGNFANSAGIQFATKQAMDALQNYYAAHGLLESGPAMKGISDYAQNMALQNYLYPYMNYLSGQQSMGAQAASAVAGVGSSYGQSVNGAGQNFANAATGINGGLANALGQGALNIGQANAGQAAIGGLANAGVGSAIGSGLGSLGSSFFQPSSVPTLPIDPFGTGNNAGF